MRVMVIVKANKDSEADMMPNQKLLTDMGKYNEELVRAGIMQAGEGLHPSSKGKRVKFSGEKRTVSDGPFGATNELIAGFWLWQVRSMDEAIEWLKRAPFRWRNRDRGPSDIRGGRFWRRVHSRTSGARGASAGEDCGQEEGGAARF